MSATIALDLKKKFELNLEKAGILNVPIMQCRAAIDRSGSMDPLFRSGWVGKTVDLFIGAALKFDDNGELEMGFFNGDFHAAPVALADDAGTYMSTKARGVSAHGGTCFAPIVDAFENEPEEEVVGEVGFLGKLFGKKPATAPKKEQMRAYVGIVTDGDNQDFHDFEEALHDTSGLTFYQFIGIGDGVNVKYLTDLSNRFKHVGFVHIQDPTKMTPDSFYEALCNPKFAAWI